MFSTVTLLITHYNRSQSLQRLLQAFVNQQIEFGDIVVSDDGSKPEHLDRLREIQNQYKFRLVTAPKNSGLGNNINKGQDAVTTPYTLYVQEDFDPKPGYATNLKNALEIMDSRPELDIARFYAYFKYPYLKPVKYGFSEMKFKIWYPGYRKFHMYSDHPHLRRTTFLNKFGRYNEDRSLNIEQVEFKMAITFLKRKGKGIFYENFNDIFDQVNTLEPSTMVRKGIKHMDGGPVWLAKAVYRNVVHTLKVLF